jgi:hypothetical protein
MNHMFNPFIIKLIIALLQLSATSKPTQHYYSDSASPCVQHMLKAGQKFITAILAQTSAGSNTGESKAYRTIKVALYASSSMWFQVFRWQSNLKTDSIFAHSAHHEHMCPYCIRVDLRILLRCPLLHWSTNSRQFLPMSITAGYMASTGWTSQLITGHLLLVTPQD